MSGFHVSRKLCFCSDKECTYFDNSFRCISVYLKVGACSVRKEKTTPFGINLMRSQVLYRAAQEM